jgi:hypothetical protein
MLLKHSLCCWIDNAVNFTELVPTEIPTEIPTEMSTVISLFMSATDGILEANDHSLQAGVRSISWFFEHMHWDKWIDEATSDNRSIGFKCVQYPKTEDHVMLRIALAVHAIFDDYQTRLLDISYLIRRKVMASKWVLHQKIEKRHRRFSFNKFGTQNSELSTPAAGFSSLQEASSRRRYEKLAARLIVALCRLVNDDQIHFPMSESLRTCATRLVLEAAASRSDDLAPAVLSLSKAIVYCTANSTEGASGSDSQHVLIGLLAFLCVDHNGQFVPVQEVTPLISQMQYWCRLVVLNSVLAEMQPEDEESYR